MEYWKLVWVFVVAFLLGGYQSEGCWEIEKAALFQLKPFFPRVNGEGISWGKGNCCRWNGVECSTSTGRVTRLFLWNSCDLEKEDIYLGWYLNISLFLPFEELKSLDLSGNYIAGFIDNQELDNLKNLKELYLKDNKTESLQSKRQLRLTKLEMLDLRSNYFNSSIFSSLAVFPHLKSLNIESNNLTEWSNIQDLNVLSNLKILNISYEGKNNSAPSQDNKRELKLMSLEELNLWGNVFNSYILSSLGSLSNLKSLSLYDAYAMEGPIGLPALKNLEILYLERDNENGSTVVNLQLQSLDIFPSLKTLFLENFSLKGTIMIQRWQNLKELTLMGLFGTSNIIRDIGTLTSLEDLVIYGCDVNDNLNLHVLSLQVFVN